jgi:hypothetical protein
MSSREYQKIIVILSILLFFPLGVFLGFYWKIFNKFWSFIILLLFTFVFLKILYNFIYLHQIAI